MKLDTDLMETTSPPPNSSPSAVPPALTTPPPGPPTQPSSLKRLRGDQTWLMLFRFLSPSGMDCNHSKGIRGLFLACLRVGVIKSQISGYPTHLFDPSGIMGWGSGRCGKSPFPEGIAEILLSLTSILSFSGAYGESIYGGKFPGENMFMLLWLFVWLDLDGHLLMLTLSNRWTRPASLFVELGLDN
ncbi:unnamed protein product [Ilex paraguariensis]|uniref:Uncharacterized protein n=1 Tax=Ilex paraguariensis TaxID=185542 RepID=A0ABC8SZG0_9AQUA